MVTALVVVFGLTMLFAAASSRAEAHIKALMVQGFILFLLVVIDYKRYSAVNLAFLCLETFAFKTVLIPRVLRDNVRKNNIFRDLEPDIPVLYSLIVISAIYLAGFMLTYWSFAALHTVAAYYFGISISVIIASLFMIMTNRKLITHVMCYAMIENGIFLLSLSVAKEMPLIVNLGVLLDIFMVIFLLGLFLAKINTTFDETDVDVLRELKD